MSTQPKNTVLFHNALELFYCLKQDDKQTKIVSFSQSKYNLFTEFFLIKNYWGIID